MPMHEKHLDWNIYYYLVDTNTHNRKTREYLYQNKLEE